MSANTIRLSTPLHALAAFWLGAAAAGACGAALAALMAARGLSPALAGPLATAAVCAGSLFGGWVLARLQKQYGLLWGAGLGAAYALALLGVQLARGIVPDAMQFVRLGLVLLSAAAGGFLAGRRTPRRRH